MAHAKGKPRETTTEPQVKPREADGASNGVSIDPALLDEIDGLVDDPLLWFTTPNEVFEGRQPIELLGTPEEPRLRNRILMAKLGMFS